jgi:hypothetical protein
VKNIYKEEHCLKNKYKETTLLLEKQIQRRAFLVKRNKIAYERDAGKIIEGCQKHRTHNAGTGKC